MKETTAFPSASQIAAALDLADGDRVFATEMLTIVQGLDPESRWLLPREIFRAVNNFADYVNAN